MRVVTRLRLSFVISIECGVAEATGGQCAARAGIAQFTRRDIGIVGTVARWRQQRRGRRSGGPGDAAEAFGRDVAYFRRVANYVERLS